MLRKCDDFLLLDLENTDWSPALAGKSQFYGKCNFNHFSLKILQGKKYKATGYSKFKRKFLVEKKSLMK